MSEAGREPSRVEARRCNRVEEIAAAYLIQADGNPSLALRRAFVAGSVPGRALELRSSPPIPSSFNLKKTVADWIKSSFVEAPSLRSVMISDPVPIDLPSSSANWLVCIELDARAKGGDYMGPRRFALGFQVSEPTAEQRGINPTAPTTVVLIPPNYEGRLPAFECDRYPLQWRPWPDWARSSDPAAAKRHGRQKGT